MCAIISTYVHDLPLAADITQFEIPGFDITTNAGAKALMSTLRGEVGPAPNIFITVHTLPAGSNPTVDKGGTNLAPTFDFGLPTAQNGKTPMFQVAGGYIQYRFDVSEAWQNLMPTDDLAIHYEDLTPEQIAELQTPAVEGKNNADEAAQEARDAAAAADTAAQAALDAAAAAENGKTPVMQAGTATALPEGQPPTVTVTETGTDPTSGAPIYTIDLGLPKGDQGFSPVITGGTIAAGDPASTPVLTFTETGTDPSGAPVYTVTGSIPRGEQGYTPTFVGGTITSTDFGTPPILTFTQTGEDPTTGAPVYTITGTMPKGEQGYTPVFVGDSLTAGAPDSQPVLVFLPTGTDPDTGAPIYTITGSIPKGDPGDGSGNVQVDGTGLLAGQQYVFVPNNDNSTIGTFQEVTINSAQADAAQTDDTASDYIKNLADVARTGSYSDLLDKPSGSFPIVTDVTNMLTTNSPNARFVARMTGHIDDKKVIEVYGEDTSGTANDLIITAALGFGADNNDPKCVREYATPDATTPTDYKIITTAELSDGTNGTFTVPNGCPEFYFKYFVGTVGVVPVVDSHWIDTSDTYFPFHLEDTPFSNFNPSGSPVSVTINGISVGITRIRSIAFSEEYTPETSIVNGFLFGCTALVSLNLTNLSNITTIGTNFLQGCSSIPSLDLTPFSGLTILQSNFLYGCTSLTSLNMSSLASLTTIQNSVLQNCSSLTFVNLSAFTNVTRIGNDFVRACQSLTSVDLSGLTNITNIGSNFFVLCSNITMIQIRGVDFSTVSIANGAFDSVTNTTAGTLRADSTYLAQAFKAKVPRISNWTVVIN